MHRKRGGLDAGLRGIEQQRIVGHRPPRHIAPGLRLSGQRLRQLVAACILRLIQQQQEQGAAIGAHAAARVPHFVASRQVVVAMLDAVDMPGDFALRRRSTLEHVGLIHLQIGLDPRVSRVQLCQRTRTVGDSVFLDLDPGSTRFIQTPQRVGGHERMIAVRLPPTPAAIIMLVVVEALEAGRHLPIQGRQPFSRHQLQLGQRARHEQVGQKARQRLLGAPVWIGRQKVECAKHGARERGGQRDRNSTGNWIGAFRNSDHGGSFARADNRARGAGFATNAEGQHGQRQFDRVGVVLGLGGHRDRGRADGLRRETPVVATFAAAGERRRSGCRGGGWFQA